MEGICGKQASVIEAATLAARIAGYGDILIDIGTGDGRYVRTIARQCPASFAIGVDACRENLRGVSRNPPCNVLFVIANALTLPRELYGLATRVTINFPWGSLLAALLDSEPTFFRGLAMLAQPGATLEIRLNQGALAEAGCALEEGAMRIRQVLREWDFHSGRSETLDAGALRIYPTTWARRLAYGRDPRGWFLAAKWPRGTAHPLPPPAPGGGFSPASPPRSGERLGEGFAPMCAKRRERVP